MLRKVAGEVLGEALSAKCAEGDLAARLSAGRETEQMA